MRFHRLTIHDIWNLDTEALFLGHRFVFADPNATPTGGAPTADQSGTTSSTQSPEDLEEIETKRKEKREREEKEREERENKQSIDKLDKRRERKEISKDTHEDALESLKSKGNPARLAKMLANGKIDEELYNRGQDSLEADSAAQKLLAKNWIRGKIKDESFQSAVDDLESENTYRAPLARRFALGQIKEADFEMAHNGLASQDMDEKHSSQGFALNHIGPDEFRQQYNLGKSAPKEAESTVETQQDAVESTRDEIHEKITELMLSVNVHIKNLPEQERTRPILKLKNNILGLNNRDRSNQNSMIAYMRKLREESILTDKQINEILEFDVENKDSIKLLRQKLQGMNLRPADLKNIVKMKEEEYYIEKDFEVQSRAAIDVIKAAATLVQYEVWKNRVVEEAEALSGITLKPGTKLQYVYPDSANGNIRTQTITKVEIVDAKLLNGVGADADVIGKQPVGLTIFMDNGEHYTVGRFAKWVNASDVCEVVSTQQNLESMLGLSDMGMGLKAGQNLDYSKGYHLDKGGNPIPDRESIQIESIDDQKVVFKAPVVTLNPDDDPQTRLTGPRMVREMNLGEFAKWARRQEMMPELKTLEALRENLKQYSATKNQKEKRNPAAYPPISVEPEEVLQWGDMGKNQIQIKEADDTGVTFKNGDKMTLPQFLGWVKTNKIERSKPEDIAERKGDEAAEMGKEFKEEAKKKGLLDAMKDFSKKMSEGFEGKSFFETVSPYLPHPAEGAKISFINNILGKYEFVSLQDIINLGKEILEFIKRKHTRRSKGRYGKIGGMLPSFLGTEFDRVYQAAETEEVNQYKSAMEQWGSWEILAKLHTTSSKDEAKACFIALNEKGELRWDDMKVWSTLNRLSARYTSDGARYYIPLDHAPHPHPDDPTKLVSGEDRVKEVIDIFWGVGQHADWYSANVNKYNSNRNNFLNKGRQLEADPKGTEGLRGEMRRLLKDWKAGVYVNPQEYEGLLEFAISAGKLSMEQKMFFLIEGVTARCGGGAMEGMTLLHIDRIGDIEGRYLNQLPLLDYFTNKGPKPFHPRYLEGEISLKETERGYTVVDYEMIRDAHFKSASEQSLPDKKFSQFLWEHMMMDPNFRSRLSKGLKSADKMDHEDAPFFIPPSTMEDIKTLTGTLTGNQKYFSNEGYMNAYAGFNQYIISLSNHLEELIRLKEQYKDKGDENPIQPEAIKEVENQMLEAIQCYYLYDSFLSGRRDGENSGRARLDQSRYDKPPIVDNGDDGMKVKGHQAQLNNMVKEVCDAYGIDYKTKRLFDYKPPYGKKTQQTELEASMEEFLKVDLPEAIRNDPEGPKKMLEIIRNKKLKGIVNRTSEDALGGMETSNRIIYDEEYKKEAEKLFGKAA